LTSFARAPTVPVIFSYGADPWMRCRGFEASILHVLGYLDQALRQIHVALAQAREQKQVQILMPVLTFAASLHGGRREWAEMQRCAAELSDLAMAHSLPFWWALGRCNHGVALTQQDKLAEGIDEITQGLAFYRAMGANSGIPRFLGWLAEAYGRARRIDEGFVALTEAFALIERDGEQLWEGELYRRKGELLLAQEGCRLQAVGVREKAKEAEKCFLKAIEIARQQQTKLFELRATMSLARLWRRQGKTTAARQRLAEIYDWFTEGFGAADLQEARALLEELA
jgi:predicted ATPase